MIKGVAFGIPKSFLVVISCSFGFSRMRLVARYCAERALDRGVTDKYLNSLKS